MATNKLKLPYPPIVEAIVEIDCDMPLGLDIAKLEKPAFEVFKDRYPKVQNLFSQMIETKIGIPGEASIRKMNVEAVRFAHEDGKQIVQLRRQGYAFNRLTPYSSLDDYLPEIQRTWKIYTSLVSPPNIKAIRLRYINRIPLPLKEGIVNLGDYLKTGPSVPDKNTLQLASFLNRYSAVEKSNKNRVDVILAGQPMDRGKLPIILDITAKHKGSASPENWAWVSEQIELLRDLKNQIFIKTLSESCLNLFQQP